MTVAKPLLTVYSPGDVTGYIVSAANYNTEVLQQGAWTQLMLEPQTSFPSSPNTSDTCFRSDLGAWYRYDGTAWQQMGGAAYTTASRPASPPTGYWYFDLTLNNLYYYTGSAYAALPQAPVDISTATAATIPLTVENTNATPTGDLQQWKANGAVVAAIGPTGNMAQGSDIATYIGFAQSQVVGSSTAPIGTYIAPTLKPNASATSARGLQVNPVVDTTNGVVPEATALYINAVTKTGANAVTSANAVYITVPTIGSTNVGLAFNTPAGAIAQEAWTAPTFLNSWVNNAFGYQSAKYMKDTEGFVHARGMIVGGASTTVAWTMPAGYVNSAPEPFAQAFYNAGVWGTAITLINVSGAVTPLVAVPAGSMVGVFASYDTR